jgi:hypothetical protein
MKYRREDDWIEFKWKVSLSGYRLVSSEGAAVDDLVRTQLAPLSHNRGEREYRPLADYPTLFWVFAEAEVTPESCISLANEYGGLTAGARYGKPESLDLWLGTLKQLGCAVSLFRALQEKDEQWLQNRIVWGVDAEDGGEAVWFRPSPDAPRPEWRGIASTRLYPFWLEHLNRQNSFLPAVVFLRNLVNGRLDGHVSPHLNYVPDGSNPLFGLRLDLEPMDLLGALWLQLARALHGNLVYRQCLACRQRFELAPGRGRSDKNFCSGACRARRHRDCAVKAVGLKAGGKSIGDISEMLETTEGQVKKWLKSGQKGGKPQ